MSKQSIECPNCHTIFQVDDTFYMDIVNQIKTKEIEKEKKVLETQFKQQLALQETKNQAHIESTKSSLKEEFQKDLQTMQNNLSNVTLEKERLKKELESIQEQLTIKAKLDLEQTKSTLKKEYDHKIQEASKEIFELRSQLQNLVNEANIEKEKTRSLQREEVTKYELALQTQKEKYEQQLRLKDEQVAYYKDFKARQSTKMVGESLERHCETEFNKLRATGFQNAYFEKDNDASSGSKGDYIYKEYDEEGNEIISIMFEMKNENETTATKKKNEDFFKELDKDRHQKQCEYAILVSMLEPDNEYYNTGIVDVSYRYEKMYVIRPQFFIPMITLLRNAAKNAADYRKQLSIYKQQNIDITHFEENMNTFKEAFARNYDLASRKFKTAIDEIDKTILHLQKTKDALISSENNLRLANNKADDLSIKKLTKNAPSLAQAFQELKK